MSLENSFDNVYKSKRWGSKTLSGPGSTLASSKKLLVFLRKFIVENNIKKIVDGSCGDCNWIMILLEEFPEIEYIGNDISSEIIQINRNKFGKKYVFEQKDLLGSDNIPDCDLFIFRHTMMHLSNENNLKIFDKMKDSDCYFLLTHHDDIYSNPKDTERIRLNPNFPGALCWKKMNMHKTPYNIEKSLIVSQKESSNNTNEYANIYKFKK
tara:strand:+ start:294 stop:923 length:630 start_codon:yes stop_codon:yes gene_type:complete